MAGSSTEGKVEVKLVATQAFIAYFIIGYRTGQYTAEKSKRRYFCHTSIDIEQKILYRQTEIP